MDSIGITGKASTRWNYGPAGELIAEALASAPNSSRRSSILRLC